MALDDDLRRRMGETAVKIVRATGYTNAGTVEFLLDRDRNFYFLEVNARIQVEHPVTEMVVGVDLVKQQLEVACGGTLSFRQEDLSQRGHAIECRIYAENPENGFLPSPGKILLLEEPEGPGIRCDSGIYSGLVVTPFYDPILSKLIVWAEDRETCRQRMIAALGNYTLLGIATPIGFLADVLKHPEFAAGRTHTHFIAKHMPNWKQMEKEDGLLEIALIAGALAGSPSSCARNLAKGEERPTPWQSLGKWAIGGR
jgi:acetyl-CoA carboxylase biotin carboxylase subunit